MKVTYGSMSLIEELICLVVMFIYIEKKKNYQRRETFFLGKSWSDFSQQVYTTIQSNQKFKRATVTRQSVCYQATLKP